MIEKTIALEKERLEREGLRSGQNLLFYFERDPTNDEAINLGSFEEPA